MRLDGKVVLVTGGSRGIGAAIVAAAVAAGGSVIIHYGRQKALAEAAVQRAPKGRCSAVGADLLVPVAADALWRDALAWQGRIDVLVNNAGIYEPALMDGDDAQWTAAWGRCLQINLVAAGDLCRHAVRHFCGRGGGTIINIASRAAFRGDAPDYGHYAASKGGMIALTRTIARGYAKEGVLAYAVAPGFVATEMAEETMRDPVASARITAEIPIGAIAPPEDVANVVVFLAAGLAPHATGTTVDINGASYVR